jgi:hypothetical protein
MCLFFIVFMEKKKKNIIEIEKQIVGAKAQKCADLRTC